MNRRLGPLTLTLVVLAAVYLLLTVHALAKHNKKPKFITGDIYMQKYDGIENDLLTGGLGQTGIAFGAPQPVFVDPANPNAEELRVLAIQTNYRAVMDPSPAGGYGVLYGPAVGPDGGVLPNDGKIAGKEYLAYADDGSGKKNVTLMVQIPDTFDPKKPCIVTGPSSGSRGVYGAIGTSGEWGLKHGCAVCYSDGGKGTGAHDLEGDTVNLIRGQREDATTADLDSHFTAIDDLDALAEFNAAFPNRYAFKHAHSQQNPELDWGQNVLQAIEFAFYVLNLDENFGNPKKAGKGKGKGHGGQVITPKNTIVIASSISNGGSASIRAAEEDKKGLIDGVAVSEPNLTPKLNKKLIIRQGDRTWTSDTHSKLLYDYFSYINVYQPCADLAQPDASLNTAFVFGALELAENRCASLAELGLLTRFHGDGTETTAFERAGEARALINDYGILEEQNWVQPTQQFFEFNEAITVTYANAYGRFSVIENLCGVSFAGVLGQQPAPLDETVFQALFGVSSGVPPTGSFRGLGGIQLINNDSLGGAVLNRFSLNSDGIQDQNLAAALCYRSLFTGLDANGKKLKGDAKDAHKRVEKGLKKIPYKAKLKRIPAIIVHGRNDGVVPLNHSTRPYFGVNRIKDKKSKLHYYEVTNANHLDAFIPFFVGFQVRYIPLHYYFDQAMDLMYDHLKNGTPLPPSQVVRTVPRGENVPDITAANVPDISADPAEGDLITLVKKKGRYTLTIPE